MNTNCFRLRQLLIRGTKNLEGCVLANRLIYNPRFVIQNVLDKVLAQRDLFQEGNFLPPTFGAQSRSLPA